MSDDFGQPHLSESEIVELLLENGIATAKDLAESRRRENVIRIQLREMAEDGWVVEFSQGLFRLSDSGFRFAMSAASDSSARHLTSRGRLDDFSEMDAETIKQFNMELYESPTQQYGLVDESHDKTIRRIRNVKESRLNRLIEEFPTNEPVCEQCAHWARAISGKHFFPDANHRTAMASLSALLDLNDIDIPEWP